MRQFRHTPPTSTSRRGRRADHAAPGDRHPGPARRTPACAVAFFPHVGLPTGVPLLARVYPASRLLSSVVRRFGVKCLAAGVPARNRARRCLIVRDPRARGRKKKKKAPESGDDLRDRAVLRLRCCLRRSRFGLKKEDRAAPRSARFTISAKRTHIVLLICPRRSSHPSSPRADRCCPLRRASRLGTRSAAPAQCCR